MKNTSLCYIEKDGQYLMLHRIKKHEDPNAGKWIGVGGKFLEGESPEECMLRETREETGLSLKSWRIRGIVTFLSDKWEGEYMYLFTADDYDGVITQCDEGRLQWVDKTAVSSLPIWEGDKIFLSLLASKEPFFLLKLKYSGEQLTEAVLNGKTVL